MADALTNNRSLTQPQVGGDSGTWGGILNTGTIGQLDIVLGNTQSVSVTSADVTLSQAQWNNLALSITGTLTGARNLFLPFSPNSTTAAVGGSFVVQNNTTGSFNLTVSTTASGATGVVAYQGLNTALWSDQTSVRYMDDSAARFTPVNGSPNGQLAGTAATINNPPHPLAWDYSGGTGAWAPTTTGTSTTTVWSQVGTIGQPLSAPQGLFQNLSIKVASNTTVTVSAGGVLMYNAGSTKFLTAAISATCNLGSNGAVNSLDTGTIAVDTWYYIYAISNGTTNGTLASTSSTSPTLPSGYIYFARIGAVRTIHASATLYGTLQLGRRAQYVVGLAQTTGLPLLTSGVAGNISTPVWSAVAVGSLVPPTASAIRGNVGNNGPSNTIVQVAPNNSFGANNNTANPPYLISFNSINNFVVPFEMTLESTNIYWNNNGAANLYASGWEDNL